MSGADDATVRAWNISTGEEIKRYEGISGKVNSLFFGRDGLIIVGSDRMQTLDLASGQPSDTFKGSRSKVASIMMSPDATKILSVSGDPLDPSGCQMWDVVKGNVDR